MPDHFNIKFEADGVVYEGRVWPGEDEGNSYFQVAYHLSDEPHQSKMILLETSEVGNWVEKKQQDEEADASHEFIAAIGKEIEEHRK